MAKFGKYLSAGDFRHSITIKLRTETRDATGGITDGTPTTVHTTRAKIEPIRGNELTTLASVDGAINRASVDYRIWIRKPPSTSIKPEQFVVYDSKEFDILSVIEPNTEGRYLELLCKERFA